MVEPGNKVSRLQSELDQKSNLESFFTAGEIKNKKC
jgi:hypothetical protein